MPKKLLTDADLTDLPWEDDEGNVSENLDAQKLRRYVLGLKNDKIRAQNARDASIEEKDELETEVSRLKDAGADASKADATVTELRAEIKDLKKAAEQPSETELRLTVAIDKGLTKRQAMRLTGKTLEELEEDADAYLEEVGGVKPKGKDGEDDDEDDDEVLPGSTLNRRPRDMKHGSNRDVASAEGDKLPEVSWTAF